jgi:hypothetical protein
VLLEVITINIIVQCSSVVSQLIYRLNEIYVFLFSNNVVSMQLKFAMAFQFVFTSR